MEQRVDLVVREDSSAACTDSAVTTPAMDSGRCVRNHATMITGSISGRLAIAALGMLACACATGAADARQQPVPTVHYVEIVCRDTAAQCTALERVHGWVFGQPDADLGEARVALAADGCRIGVRAPLSEHELPIVRTYLEVDDIEAAIEAARRLGAAVAYPPTRQGASGTWAIYVVGDIQCGLWQR